jgi:hypothetical protein
VDEPQRLPKRLGIARNIKKIFGSENALPGEVGTRWSESPSATLSAACNMQETIFSLATRAQDDR